MISIRCESADSHHLNSLCDVSALLADTLSHLRCVTNRVMVHCGISNMGVRRAPDGYRLASRQGLQVLGFDNKFVESALTSTTSLLARQDLPARELWGTCTKKATVGRCSTHEALWYAIRLFIGVRRCGAVAYTTTVSI